MKKASHEKWQGIGVCDKLAGSKGRVYWTQETDKLKNMKVAANESKVT